MSFFFRDGFGLKWLYPGTGVKRWLLLLSVGVIAMGIGLGYLLRDIYGTWTFPLAFHYLTLQFVPYSMRALLIGAAGLSAIVIAIVQLNRSPLGASLRSGRESTVETAYPHRRFSQGPKVVAIGGGTGLSTLLRGLKEYTSDITAIVTVADDGGSSGRLRRELGLLPPGDFRNCIAALADAEPLTTQLFQYRFGGGVGLNGHSFGNLFIAAMAGVTGDFERAILESSRVLAVRGRIVPSTLENVTLCADLRGEDKVLGQLSRVEGESKIPEAGLPIERVFLRPKRVRAYPGALRAILSADLILAGPGSLYTSILPNLLVEDITQAIRTSQAVKLYICNVATQVGETDHFTVGDHVQALQDHVGKDVFPYVLANDNFDAQLPPQANIELVPVTCEATEGYQVVTADLIDLENAWRHDSKKLARKVIEFYHQQCG
ncbi:MAG TPA: YvcK family protein [Anaerolineae bacterium]|nr:YvcK family protein [Anaerolineae bacterium]